MGLRDTWFNPRGSFAPSDLCAGRVAPPVVGAPAVAPGALFTPLAPRRLVDTRDGTGTSATPIGADCTLVVDPGVDPSATAVAVNLTSVNTYAAKNGLDKLVANGGLLGQQLIAIGITLALSIVGTVVIAMVVKVLIGLRPSPESETAGLDISDHGEEGYDF